MLRYRIKPRSLASVFCVSAWVGCTSLVVRHSSSEESTQAPAFTPGGKRQPPAMNDGAQARAPFRQPIKARVTKH